MSDFVSRSTRRHRSKPMPEFEVRLVRPGHEIALLGEINVHTIAAARDAVNAAIEVGEGELRLLMRGAEVADAAGLGMLVGADRRAARAGRTLVLSGVSPRLDRVIRSTKLSRLLTWTAASQAASA